MPRAAHTEILSSVQSALNKPLDFDGFLAKLGPKDRLNAERHVAACEAEPDPRHAVLWKRLVCALMTLAPHQAKLNAQTSAQFFVPDGKYKMQVFAIEDLRDGTITVYCTDVLEEAAKAGLLSIKKKGAETTITVRGTEERLNIEALDGKTPNPVPFVKDMLGWNRRALRISIPIDATGTLVTAVEQLCAISVRKWLNAAAPA